MKIGLWSDCHNFPSLPLMKISAYHKQQGDEVELAMPLCQYDKVYVSRTFGDEYTKYQNFCFQAKEIVYGGTGFALKIENGKEVYEKSNDVDLPFEIEHIYPDYSLYPELTKNTAYGFLTRGCPNNCSYCLVSKKEGLKSRKVANLSEFWKGQTYIKLLDGNLLACNEREELLQQLIESKARVDFTQGLDARFITPRIMDLLTKINLERVHFAFDFMKNEKVIIKGLKLFKERSDLPDQKTIVYMLTNYDTSIEEDLYRLNKISELGYLPDVRIYRKSTAPQILKDMQRWCNNRKLYRSCDFMDYVPRKDGKAIKELYFNE